MLDTFFQMLFDFLAEGIHHVGAALKWPFLRKRYTYKQILEQEWNHTLGICCVFLIASIIVHFSH